MYTPSTVDAEFRQGEIISGLLQYAYDPENDEIIELAVEYGIIASQDCDLLRDHETWTANGQETISNILIFPANLCHEASGGLGGSDIWKLARQNRNERYHVLQEITEAQDLQARGIPALLIDFRHFLTVTPKQLRWQVSHGTALRRCRMISPYGEHFQSRSTNYLSRVSLDPPHDVPK